MVGKSSAACWIWVYVICFKLRCDAAGGGLSGCFLSSTKLFSLDCEHFFTRTQQFGTVQQPTTEKDCNSIRHRSRHRELILFFCKFVLFSVCWLFARLFTYAAAAFRSLVQLNIHVHWADDSLNDFHLIFWLELAVLSPLEYYTDKMPEGEEIILLSWSAQVKWKR